MDVNYGILSLIPVVVVIVSAIISKRAVEPLILGALVGFFILEKQDFIIAYLDALYGQLGGSAYYVVIFGLFGIFVCLIEKSNAISGFTQFALKFANTKKKTAVLMWLIGVLMFLDNYFSILSAGIATREIADNNKMSREMFAFSVNSVACCTCVIVPISLWGVFMQGQIEQVLGLEAGTGIGEIIKSIPFIALAWVLLLFVLLYQLKIIKPFGKMKNAEIRTETTGQLVPYGIENGVANNDEEKKPVTNILNFLLPMVGVIGVTLTTKELMYGLIVAIVICFVLYIPQKLLGLGEALDTICKGFEDMFVVTAIVISAFVLQDANDALGLAPFVVNSVVGVMNANLLPVIAFIVLWVLGFATGSFWGMMAVCFPIMLPLASQLDANIYLTIGAIVSGAAAGSATCFYGDSITLSCSIAKIRNHDYLQTGLPLMIPPIVVTAIVFVILGFVI